MLRKKRRYRKNTKIKNKNGSRHTSRNYDNPFFKKKIRKKSVLFHLSLKVKMIIFSFCLLVIFLLWFFLFSSFFVIKNVKIEGGVRTDVKAIEKIARKQLRDYAYMFIAQKNIFNFNEEVLKKDLLKAYVFDHLEISKIFPDTLVIKLQEKEYAMVWKERGSISYIDEKGYVVSGASQEEIEGKNYPVVENLSDLLIADDYIGIEKEYLPVMFDFYEKFKFYEEEFLLDRFILEGDDSSFKALIKDGPEVYFSITTGVDKQMKKLIVAKNDIIKDNFNSIEYINVKIGDSVYYR